MIPEQATMQIVLKELVAKLPGDPWKGEDS